MFAPRQTLRGVALLATAAIVIATFVGCGAIGAVRATDTIELAVDLQPGTPVRVETFNGAVDVDVLDGTRATALVTRTGEGHDQAAAEADRDGIEVTFEMVGPMAVLKAVYTPDPASIPGSRSAGVSLRIPSGTPVEVVTSNGAVGIRQTDGPVEVRTSNGAVDLRGVRGDVSVDTSNGAVTIEAEPVSLDVHTSNGAVSFAGALEPGSHRLDTSNGTLTLRLPADASFTIDADTSNATIHSDFTVRGEVSERSISGAVGDEAAAAETNVNAHTSGGEINLLRD